MHFPVLSCSVVIPHLSAQTRNLDHTAGIDCAMGHIMAHGSEELLSTQLLGFTVNQYPGCFTLRIVLNWYQECIRIIMEGVPFVFYSLWIPAGTEKKEFCRDEGH